MTAEMFLIEYGKVARCCGYARKMFPDRLAENLKERPPVKTN